MRVMAGGATNALREVRMRTGQAARIRRIQRPCVVIETKGCDNRQNENRRQHA